MENFGRKFLWKIMSKNGVKELGGKIVSKEWVKNVVENCVEKMVGKIRLKN